MSEYLDNLFELSILARKIFDFADACRGLADVHENTTDEDIRRMVKPIIEISRDKLSKITEDYNARLETFKKDSF